MKYQSINRIKEYGIVIYCYLVSNYQFKMAYEYSNILKKKDVLSRTGQKNNTKGVAGCFPETVLLNIPFIAGGLAGQAFLRRQFVLDYFFFSVAKWHSGRLHIRNVSILNDSINHKWMV